MDYCKPYEHLRGFNYVPSTAFNDIAFWRDYDEHVVERELTYAQRLGLNSARVFLQYVVFERDPGAFLARLTHFVRTAHALGISTMPVIWDSCFSEDEPTYSSNINAWFPNPGVQRLGRDFWPAGERFCRDLVQCLGPEPGLAMWDVMNEPLVTSFIACAEPERGRRIQLIWDFLGHFCELMKRLDTRHPITVGVDHAAQFEQVGGWVDVLSFHDYFQFGSPAGNGDGLPKHVKQAIEFANRLHKPVFMSEVGCLARANPYDIALQTLETFGIGWYIWELMIGVSGWRDIHGVVYPDGTVRDPSIAAALRGFYRKRSGDLVTPWLNKEGAITRVLAQAREWLQDADAPYRHGVAVLEVMANLLEAGELVPMCRLPSIQAHALADESASNRSELVHLLEQWGNTLESACAF